MKIMTMITTNGRHVFLGLQTLGLAMYQPQLEKGTFKVLLNKSYDNPEWMGADRPSPQARLTRWLVILWCPRLGCLFEAFLA